MLQQYGLIGYPLGHSFSRAYFTEKFAAGQIEAEYLNFAIPSIDELPQIIAGHPRLCGLNVTIPYKEQILPLLTSLSPEAARIGAVNVVRILRTPPADGTGNETIRLIGHNTDCLGFRAAIEPHLRPHHLASGHALVLGSGGAARAVATALADLGLSPTIVSRTPLQHGTMIPGACDTLGYDDLTSAVMSRSLVIVNTTPLGMYPKVDACAPLPYHLVTPRHLCCDVVYNPEQTLFMKRCAEQGAATMGGLAMLHEQAEAAWRIWNEK